MEHVVMLVPAGASEGLTDWLYRERELHLMEFSETPAEWELRFPSLRADVSPAQTHVSRLETAAAFLVQFRKDKVDFLETLFPVRILATPKEIQQAAQEVDPQSISVECEKLRGEIQAAKDKLERLQTDADRLAELSFIKVAIKNLRALCHVAFRLVAASAHTLQGLMRDERVAGELHFALLAQSGTSSVSLLAGSVSQMSVIHELISDYALREIPLPHIDGTIAEEMGSLKKSISEATAQLRQLQHSAEKLAAKWAHKVSLALAYWESERSRTTRQGLMVRSRSLVAARGYVRAKRVAGFRRRLQGTFRGSALVSTKRPDGEEPPVSVTWNWLFRPTGLLVKMFGLPTYHSLDPTVYLSFSFLAFFGICYGDLLYGLMLIALALYLNRRFRHQRGLAEFFRLFIYAGVAAAIVGILTASWGADLPAYFGQNSPIEHLRQRLKLLDPLDKPLVALVLALFIGVANQFYGILLRGVRDLRRGDLASFFFDGVLWLVFLTGIVAVIPALFGWTPKWLLKPGLFMVLPSAVGLVLTQGRAQKGWFARLVTGVVSLYGILGTYGASSFIGDVLSYSRLLALGLTTTIVDMSFNIIGGLMKDVPFIGLPLFILVIIFGHAFNFVMSIISAFVHSARLILLEFFNRFYEAGGLPFQPFGFQSTRIEILPE